MIRHQNVSEKILEWGNEERSLLKMLITKLEGLYPKEAVLQSAWAGIGIKQGSNWSTVIYPGRDGLNIMVMQGVFLENKLSLEHHFDGCGKSTRNFRYARDTVDIDPLIKVLELQLAMFETGRLRWE